MARQDVAAQAIVVADEVEAVLAEGVAVEEEDSKLKIFFLTPIPFFFCCIFDFQFLHRQR